MKQHTRTPVQSFPPIEAELWPDIATTPPMNRRRIARTVFTNAVKRLPVRVTLPDGSTLGSAVRSLPEFVIHNETFFDRLGYDLVTGMGEAYMAGDWSAGKTTDLADVLLPFASQVADLIPIPLQRLRPLLHKVSPSHEENHLGQAQRNIARHYDLSNELFQLFLDESMMYSAAWFTNLEDASWENFTEAQMRKVDGILDYAEVTEGTKVLEIGTGWGTLAIRAAQRGAHVVTVTLSVEQAELAEQRVAEAGLSHLVEVRVQDYRLVEGTFDAVVSVEMIEAVGERYWPTYFATIDTLLRPGGHFALQSITMAHHRLEATKHTYGWIQKYIFPGGLIPSVHVIEKMTSQHTTMRIRERRDIGLDYAPTLRLWRERFNQNRERVQNAGFDEVFCRMWEYYLAYCEAGFACEYLGDMQFKIVK